MKLLTKTLLAVSAIAMTPAIANAQVAYSDVDAVIGSSSAWKTASAQMRVTYKPQFDALESRSKVLEAELNAMVVRVQADAKTNPNNPTIATQAKAIQEKQAAAQQEIERLKAPISRVEAYVLEQIDPKLDGAFTQAMAKKKVTLLVQRQAVLKNTPGTDLTADIVAELNAAVPSVSITPPAGWQPGQKGAAAAASSTPQPQGR